jgi:hypothetical protein
MSRPIEMVMTRYEDAICIDCSHIKSCIYIMVIHVADSHVHC